MEENDCSQYLEMVDARRRERWREVEERLVGGGNECDTPELFAGGGREGKGRESRKSSVRGTGKCRLRCHIIRQSVPVDKGRYLAT